MSNNRSYSLIIKTQNFLIGIASNEIKVNWGFLRGWLVFSVKSHPEERLIRMRSSRMRTARSLPYLGGLSLGVSLNRNHSGQEVTSYKNPPCGQTNASENITLPQTSFADGNKFRHFQRIRVADFLSHLIEKACNVATFSCVKTILIHSLNHIESFNSIDRSK